MAVKLKAKQEVGLHVLMLLLTSDREISVFFFHVPFNYTAGFSSFCTLAKNNSKKKKPDTEGNDCLGNVCSFSWKTLCSSCQRQETGKSEKKIPVLLFI